MPGIAILLNEVCLPLLWIHQDVRNFTRKGFADFLQSWIAPSYGASFAHRVAELYGVTDVNSMSTSAGSEPLASRSPSSIDAHNSAMPWLPQSLFAEILTDATVLCPSLLLATRLQQSVPSNNVYVVVWSMTMFCPLVVFVDNNMAVSMSCIEASCGCLLFFQQLQQALVTEQHMHAHTRDAHT